MFVTHYCILLAASIEFVHPLNVTWNQDVDDPHTAYALLHVDYYQPRLMNADAAGALRDRWEFETFRRTQATLIRSRNVVHAVLRRPEIAELQLVKNLPDPAAWLAFSLRVDFPDDCEIMRVSLAGGKAPELVKLVNAVTDTYLNEVVAAERSNREQRVAQLENVFHDIEDKSRTKRQQLHRLEQQFGIQESVVALNQKVAASEVAEIRKELRQVKLELIKVRGRYASSQRAISNMDQLPIDERATEEQVDSSNVVKEQLDRVAKLRGVVETFKRTDQEEHAE